MIGRTYGGVLERRGWWQEVSMGAWYLAGRFGLTWPFNFIQKHLDMVLAHGRLKTRRGTAV